MYSPLSNYKDKMYSPLSNYKDKTYSPLNEADVHSSTIPLELHFKNTLD